MCTKEKIIEAVSAVGTMVTDVKKELKKSRGSGIQISKNKQNGFG